MGRPAGSKNKKVIQGPLTNVCAALIELTRGLLYSKSDKINPDTVRSKATAVTALKAYKEELQKQRKELLNNLNAADHLLESLGKEAE